MESYTGLEIAVIGMAGRFPQAANIEEYWENLKNGIDCIGTFSKAEAIGEGEPERIANDPSYVASHAWLRDKEYFDASFFNYLPDEAELLDPQVRIYHEVCWEALEDSGYASVREKHPIGVFAAGSTNPRWMIHAAGRNRDGLIDDFTAAHLMDVSFLSSRIAYKLNLKGPAVYLQTACSSSLVAIHHACNSLLLGECNLALAGGVCIKNYSKKGYLYQEGMILSRDGKCRPFDHRSSGTVGGEGAGVVVLRRLKDAIRDNDHIYAVVRGSAVNNDGSGKVGYTAPSVKGQAAVIRKALKMAQLRADSISYVETHGTATQLGDPVEIEALTQVYNKNTTATTCNIGSVKSNIGHLDCAAGVAGFIKTVLSLKYRQLPPSLHYSAPNPNIDFKDSTIQVNSQLTDWSNNGKPLVAGVSSFGIGGTNAHLILGEAPAARRPETGRDFHLIALSAKTSDSLNAASSRLVSFLKRSGDISMADVESALLRGRDRFSHRKVFVCEDVREAIETLEADRTRKAVAKDLHENFQHTVFLFSGQGAQYSGMGYDLYKAEPFFRETVDACLAIAARYTTLDLRDAWMGSADKQLVNRTEYAQPLLFIIEYAMARLLMRWGVKPDYMIGHSIGEYTAACISGVFALEDAIRLVVRRGALMGSVPRGSMLSINAGQAGIAPLLAEVEEVDLAAINGDTSFVVAGTDASIESLSEKLTGLSIGCKQLRTSHAFHSFMMDGILEQFENELASVTLSEPAIPYVSNITGELVSFGEINDPAYWSRHLRSTVLFSKGAGTLLRKGKACFIELGPGRTLAELIDTNAFKGEEHVIINTIRQSKQETNDQKYLVDKLGQLWLAGLVIDWDAYFEGQIRNKLPLPGYAFEKTAYTTNFDINQLLTRGSQGFSAEPNAPGIGQCINVAGWRRAAAIPANIAQTGASSTILIFAGAEAISHHLSEELNKLGHRTITIRQAADFAVVADDQWQMQFSRQEHYSRLWQLLKERDVTIEKIIYTPTFGRQPGANSHECIGERLSDVYLGLSFLAGSLADHQPGQAIHLSVVTNYIASVSEDDLLDPLKATLLGPSKIMPSEIRNLTCKVIDWPYVQPGDGGEAEDLSLLIREVFYPSPEPLVAIRMKARWVQNFEPLPESDIASSGVTIIKNGCYLITGGAGGMGFTIAEYLALEYQAHVILIHRSDVQEEGRLKAMKEAGAQVTLYRLDVSDETGVRELALAIEGRGIKLNGLIWAAGEADHGGIIQTRKPEDYFRYLRSKVHGLLLFEKYLSLGSLDFLALFSSVGNTFYQHKFGQIGYNASNEFLESYAGYFRKRTGVHAFAINWCDWLDVGMTYKIKESQLKTASRQAINATIADAIYPWEGVQVFQHCVHSSTTSVSIHKGDIRKTLQWYRDDLKRAHAALNDPDMEITPGPASGSNGIMDVLLVLYAGFFGKPDIDAKDDFFELGGDSLKAMTLVARINKKIDTPITVRDLYVHPTVEKLALHLAGLVDARKKQIIPPAGERERYPLSSEQKKIYFLQALDPLSTAYNETKVLWLSEKPDQDKLRDVFNLLLERHESLRTSFVMDNDGLHQVIRGNASIRLGIYDWKGSTEAIIRNFIHPFDLASDLLLRVALCQKSASEYLLLIDSHHIVMDGISKGVLVDELLAAYAGLPLPQNRLTSKDYAVWQSSAAGRTDRDLHKAFWMDQFREEVGVLNLPADFPRPKIFNNNNGGDVEVRLTGDLTRRLREINRQSQTTMSNLLLSAYAILLYRLSHQSDFVIGIPVSTRTHADLERMIGMFVGTLPVRFDVHEELPFGTFLKNVQNKMLSCMENQGFPMEDLIEELKIERNTGRNPLVDVMFVFEERRQPAANAGLAVREEGYKPVPSRSDLTLMAVEEEDTLVLHFVYSRDLFRRELVERYASYFGNILTEIAGQKDKLIARIELLSPAQKQEILHGFNKTGLEVPHGRTVVSWFEEQVRKSPEHTALVFEDTKLSYRELNERASRLAHVIRENYKARYWSVIPAGTPVALYLDRGLDMVTSMLAVLKAGAAYLPISPSYPEERVAYLLRDSQTPLVVTQGHYAMRFAAGAHADSSGPVVVEADTPTAACSCAGDRLSCNGICSGLNAPIADTSLAYVIYTSGTTGDPKGVMISHRNLVHHIYAQIDRFNYTQYRRTLFSVDYVFDGSVFQLFVSLCCGLEVYVLNDEQRKSATAIEELIDQHDIEIVGMQPSILALVEKAKSPKVWIVAGETPSLETLKRLSRSARVFNVYGPTECTITASSNLYREGDSANNIGEPFGNAKLYVLDDRKRPVPVGVPGVLHIGGTGLSAGYWNRPGLTAASFIDDPFAGDEDINKLYNTGDVVRWLPEGRVEFIGRKDFQVKIRGYRVEPGEIEHLLSKHPDILQAVVVDRERGGHKYLAAYFVARPATIIEGSALREYLAAKLPDYMVPAAYVRLDAIPLTISGKLNRHLLPEPEFTGTDGYAGPENELEALLCGIWQNVLGIERVGVNDNFFSLGGDSIKSIQVSSRLRNNGYAVAVKEIFANQTIRTLASNLKRTQLSIDQAPVTGKVAISPIQDWFLNGRIKNKAHFNQSVMLNFPGGVTGETIRKVFERLLAHHDMLRCVYRHTGEGYTQEILDEAEVFMSELDLRDHAEVQRIIDKDSQQLQSGIDLGTGPLVRLGLYHLPDGSRLLVIIHHLVVDGISWRILFEDMRQLLYQIRNNLPLSLPMKTTSYQSWSETQSIQDSPPPGAPVEWKIRRDFPSGPNTFGEADKISFSLSEAETSALLKDVNAAYNTRINDLLLAALALAFGRRYKMTNVQLDMEGHGRISPEKESSIERTVGWFTSICPVSLQAGSGISDTITAVKELLRSARNYGVQYVPDGSKVSFNYLGQFDTDLDRLEFEPAGEPRGSDVGPDEERLYEWEISGIITDHRLHMTLAYSRAQYHADTIRSFMKEYQDQLEMVIHHCSGQLDVLRQQYEIEDIYPLTPLQQGILFHASLDPDTPYYFEQMTIDVEADLDIQRLTISLQALIGRHPVLRTIFRVREYERPLQIVLAKGVADLSFTDVQDLCAEDGGEAVVASYEKEDRNRRFDLEHGPLLRLTVLKTGMRNFTVIWSHHHILMDGWSAGVIWNDLTRYYINGSAGSEPPVKFSGYISWIGNQDKEASAAFWKGYLDGYHQLATIPGKQRSPAKEFELSSRQSIIDEATTRALRSRAERNETTLNTILQCAWAILLGRCNYTRDVVFGSVVSGRPAGIEGIETMVGLCINTLPVRVDLEDNPDSIDTLLRQMQQEALEAEPYHYHPLPELQAASSLGPALFDHIFVFENYPVQDRFRAASTDELKVKKIKTFEQTNYDLAVVIAPGNELKIKLDFNARVYSPETVDRTLTYLKRIIDQLADVRQDRLSEITILSLPERERLMGFNNMETSFPEEKTIIGLFEEQVARTPDNIALELNGRQLTYRQLNGRANQVGRYLRETCHIQREDRVGICLDRGFEMFYGILGILKAGGAYVPIDPDYPRERAEYMFTDSGCKVLIDADFLQNIETFEEAPDNPELISSSADLAYVIYTSGTSGRPKGALIEHRNITRLFINEKPLFHFNEKDVWTLFHSFCFDFSVWEMYGALLFGGKLVIIPKEITRDPERFATVISQQKVTVLNQTPRAFYALQEIILSILPPLDIRYVIFGGEALDPSALSGWKQQYPDCRLINMYGITETTVHVTYKEISAADAKSNISNIGQPIPTLGCYIMDRTGGLLPPGIAGELYVGGAGVARGYMGLPELTAQRFIPNPHGPGRLYRTGDLCRWLPDGDMEYLGRVDQQVKIRGYRIELGEIENQLTGIPEIGEAVAAVAGSSGDPFLVGYYTADAALNPAYIRQQLSQRLPEFMIPAHFVRLEAIPLTGNGKLDRLSLPQVAITSDASCEGPSNEIEQQLANIWADVLQLEAADISLDASFFELGGHSLKAVLLVNKINRAFDIHFPLEEVFEKRTIKNISGYLTTVLQDSGQMTSGKGPLHIPSAGQKDWYKVSAVQKRIYFIYEFDKSSLAFNMPQVIKMKGVLDKERLENAFSELIRRHESLRTSFRLIGGEPFQQILRTVDFAIRKFAATEAQIPAIVQEFVQPFDLERGPLFRVGLIEISGSEHVLMVDSHHIVSDGTSQGVLVRDFMRLYRGEILAGLELQYKDFAEWEQGGEQQAHIAQQKQYWLREFSDPPAFLQLPYDHPRPAVASGKGWTVEAILSREDTDLLRTLANHHQATLFMVVLAVYNILLSKLCNQDDIIVGTSVAGRQHVDLEDVIGMFVKSVPLRNYPKSDLSFTDFLREVRTRTLSGFDNQDVQYEELTDELQFDRDVSRNQWFDVMLIYQNFEETILEIPGLSLEPFASGIGVSKFDLTLTVQEKKGELSLKFEYATDLFDQATIERFSTYFRKIVRTAGTNPNSRIGEITIITQEEAEQVLEQFNAPRVDRPDGQTVVTLFEQRVHEHGLRPALCCCTATLSYEQLNKDINRLAHYLIHQKDVRSEDRIGLFMERSPRMVVAMMAVLKAGAAYVPVDTSFKGARINKITSNAGLKYIITDMNERLMEQMPIAVVVDLEAESSPIGHQPCSNPDIMIRGSDLAYCIYTSGSTGSPKGIAIEHQSLLDFSLTTKSYFSMDHRDHIIQQADLTFDTSVEEIFPALISGASLEIMPDAGRDSDAILRAIIRGANVLNTTPLILKELNGHADELGNLRFIIVGGDAVMSSCFDNLYQRYPVYQTYGPSEVTVGITCGRVRKLEDASNLGRPITNRKVYIMDRNGALCPVSVPGELCVSGIGLARGYVNDPELTKAKFVKNPFEPDQRMYRTGDLAKWLPDGTIQFLGRMDDMLKIRGFRIETGEIESLLLSYHGIQKAAVLARSWKSDKFIVGYYTGERAIEEEGLRSFLTERLPHYMIPSYLVQLDTIPLTSSGKINRRALPELEIKAGANYVPPETREEKALVNSWAEVLKVEKIGITDNYFALGGDSIKSIQISSKLRSYGFETSLKDIFTHQTIRELAPNLIPLRAGSGEEDLTYSGLPPQLLEKLRQSYPVEDVYTLSPMQEGMLFHALIDNGQEYYFAQVVFSISGRMNVALVEDSMNHLIARYTILRTIFLNEGFSRPIQVVLKERKIDFLYLDVREACTGSDEQLVIEHYRTEDKKRPFDLSTDVLMRLTVLQTRDDGYELIWSYHHIVMDGWCMGIIFRDFMAIYSQLTDRGEVILPPAKPYAQFIKWLARKDRKDAVSYWSGYLEGYEALAGFPKRRTVGNEPAGFTKGASTVRISGAILGRLNELAARLGVTLNTLVQVAWGILLSRYNATNDVVFAAVVSGRPDDIEGMEDMVGLFINSIPVRVRYEREDTVEELLRWLQLRALESARYNHYPLSEIQVLSELGRGLLDHIMAFENLPIAEKLKDHQERGDSAFTVTSVREFERPNYDLWIIINPGDALQINLNYNAELYDAGFMQRAAGHLDRIIRQMTDKPLSRVGEIDILTGAERNQILFQFNDTAAPYDENVLMHQLFEERARVSPGLTAVVSGGKDYSYDWLNKQSNVLAHYLREHGITRGASVVVIMNRAVGLIVALYAILKAGGKYVPVEPDLPEGRTLSILDSVEAALIITNTDNLALSAGLKKKAAVIPDLLSLDDVDLSGYSNENLAPLSSSEELAYVIFTSGSTGTPKGVAVQHKPAINLIEWVNKQYRVSAEDKILLVSSISFDLSVYDIFGGLAAGACIRIADEQDLSDPEVLANIVIDEGITFWDSAPAMLQQVIPFLEQRKEDALQYGKLRISFSSGDWIPLTMPPRMQQLFNRYQFVGLGGATEATIWSNFFEVGPVDPSWNSIPYGKPIQNAKYLVLDSRLNLCPIGVQGDLYIGGQCLAREYINDSELSGRKFIDSPFYAGEKLYNTGDTARWFPDGHLEFMGRKDTQVKIRGYRIELGEIENVLSKLPGISEVLAQVLSRTRYDKFICAYYRGSREYTREELQQYMSRHLPEYMIPSYFIPIDEIPVTKNGKLDRKRLPDPRTELNSSSQISRPRSANQQQLLQIWAKLLHLPEDRLGVTHDFFELGGHSVMAVHLIAQIYETFEARIKLREVFEHPTIAGLAGLIDTRKRGAAEMIPRLAKQEHYIASSAQERMFFAHMQNPSGLGYNISGAYAIRGEADEDTIARCLQTLVDRHESLRTSFTLGADGVTLQVHDQVKVDFSVNELDQHTTLSEAFSAFVRPFDLASTSLIGFRLLKTREQERFFFVNVHHIVCDGISLNILMNEFKRLYRGEQLDAPDTQYTDYAHWQRTAKGEPERQKEYWLSQLSGGLPTLALPTSRSRGTDITPAAAIYLTIEGEQYKKVKEFNAGTNASDFMLLLSVFQILLSRISGSMDIVVATDATGRTHPQLSDMVGTFVNILPLRIQVRPEQIFGHFLEDVREMVLGAYDNQGYAPEVVAEVHFSMANYYSSQAEIENLIFEPVRTHRELATQYEFKLEAMETEGRFVLQFIYSTALYDAGTIEALAGYYRNILTAVIANPGIPLEEIDA